MSIISSTSAIMEVNNKMEYLEYKVITPGKQEIIWSKSIGKPLLSESSNPKYQLDEADDEFKITIEVIDAMQPVRILKNKAI